MEIIIDIDDPVPLFNQLIGQIKKAVLSDQLLPGDASRWFKIVQRNDFDSFEALRATFPSADKVGDLIVFNIGGNKYRLIASIHFNRGKVYIRHVLTHSAYDRGGWKP